MSFVATDRRAATRDAANALVDDLEHMRSMLSRADYLPGDIRRLSAQLRRILIDSDIQKIASPRIGRIHIESPDIDDLIRSGDRQPWHFFSGGLALDSFAYFAVDHYPHREKYPFDQAKRVRMSLRQFLGQRVIFYQNVWATRRDIIKYVANKAHGVHTTRVQHPVDIMLRHVRGLVTLNLSVTPASATFTIIDNDDIFSEVHFDGDPSHFDLVLMHLISFAILLTRSSDVVRLEKKIRAEH